VQSSASGDAAESKNPTNADAKRRLLTETHGLVISMHCKVEYLFFVVLVLVLGTSFTVHAQAVDMHSVVDTLLSKYKSAGQTWTITIENAARPPDQIGVKISSKDVGVTALS
jgi:hypothetical protein